MECSFLKRDLYDILLETMISVIVDKQAMHPFRMGDASSSLNGLPCAGHPTHRNLTEVDFDYPTVSGKGTQYGKYTDGSHESIWLDSDPDKMILDEDKIDWLAIYQLIIRLKRKLKGHSVTLTQFIIHERIFDLIVRKAGLYGNSFTEFNSACFADTRRNYNHDTHMHFNLDMGF